MSTIPATREYMKASVERTSRWAESCLRAHARPNDQGLFGIVQGGEFEDLACKVQKILYHLIFRVMQLVDFRRRAKRYNERSLEFTTPLLPPINHVI